MGAQAAQGGDRTPQGSGGAAAPAVPAITAMDPTEGPWNSFVTFTLANMPPSFPLDGVSFNGTNSGNVIKNSDTEVQAQVPFTATTGPVTISHSSGSSVVSATDFTVA